MKTIQVNIYTFSELSEDAKQRAIETWRNDTQEYAWQDENKESMEAFARVFPIAVTEWSYGGRGEGVYFRFETERDEIEELSGQRLAIYLWNNYRRELYKGKYYGRLSLRDKNGKKIRKSKEFPIGQRHVIRHSKIILDTCCVFTGYCMDDALTDNIYAFMDKPDARTFRDLLEDCFSQWIKACNADIEWQNSDEYISETIEANDYEFDEDGNRM